MQPCVFVQLKWKVIRSQDHACIEDTCEIGTSFTKEFYNDLGTITLHAHCNYVQSIISVLWINKLSSTQGNNTYDVSQSPQPQQQQQPPQQRIPTLDQISYDNFSQLNDGLSSPNHQNSPENIIYGSHGNMSPVGKRASAMI